MMLKDKKILLGVCGSVSFYKAYELVSNLKKLGADVKVMLSDGALKFCNPLSFEAITNHPVLCTGNEDWQKKISHIEYAKVDLILIAPASVNTINSLASGVCSSIFMQTLIASNAPMIIAPAANNKMLEHFSTVKNLDFLKKNGVKVVEPVTKMLACKDIGKGGLADISNILYEVKKAFFNQTFKGKKVIITGGATTEKIDDVRAITNNSSGKMSKALSDAFFFLGADVMLISSVKYENLPYKSCEFKNTDELLSLCKAECKDSDLLVMCVAVSDYICKQNYDFKLKKSELGKEWGLELKQNIDVLSSLKDFKCKKIGFKLEYDKNSAYNNAKNMLIDKNLDAVCLNVIEKENSFGSEKNKINFITKEKDTLLEIDTKENIAIKIANLASEL